MTREDIFRMAQEVELINKDYDFAFLNKFTDKVERFAALIASAEREHIYAEQFELPEPRLTGKFSITAGKFKCTGCTGTWTNREDAKHHSCKDYQ